jgi:hypothetical protein
MEREILALKNNIRLDIARIKANIYAIKVMVRRKSEIANKMNTLFDEIVSSVERDKLGIKLTTRQKVKKSQDMSNYQMIMSNTKSTINMYADYSRQLKKKVADNQRKINYIQKDQKQK